MIESLAGAQTDYFLPTLTHTHTPQKKEKEKNSMSWFPFFINRKNITQASVVKWVFLKLTNSVTTKTSSFFHHLFHHLFLCTPTTQRQVPSLFPIHPQYCCPLSLGLFTSRYPLHSALWIPHRSFVRGPSTIYNSSTGLSCQEQQFSNCFATVTYECTLQARAWIRYIVWLQYPALYIPYFLGASSQNWFLPLMHSYFILFTWNTPLIAVCGQYLYMYYGRLV